MGKVLRAIDLGCAAVLLSLLSGAAAQASTIDLLPGSRGFVHEVFTTGDGLPAAGISQLLQTRDGFLWLATFDGLARFDGAHFEVFDSERVPALGSNRIFNLAEGRDSALWIRTEQGHLIRYANGIFAACPAPRAGRADCSLRQVGAPGYTLLQKDRSGALWAGGPGGVFRVEGNGLREVPELKVPDPVQAVSLDRTGGFWVATRDGLWRRGPHGLERIVLPPGQCALGFPTVAVDDYGEVWVAAAEAIGRLRGRTFVPEISGRGAVGEDPRGGIWISLSGRLIGQRTGVRQDLWSEPATPILIDPRRNVHTGPGQDVWAGASKTLFHNGRPAFTLSGETGELVAIHRSRDGTVWAATSRRGELHALHPARIATIAEGLPNPIVYPIYEDRDGTIWAGGGGFLASLAPGADRFRPLSNPAGPDQSVHSFLRDREGTFWVGTSRGLYTLGSGGFTPAGDERGRNLGVLAIFEDSRGGLWVGTKEGLFHREPLAKGGHWTWLQSKNGLPFPWIRVIRETPDGALWFGTNGGGVIRLAAGRFTAITHAQGLSSDLVRGLYAAPDGRLWIATENGGLSRLDPAAVGQPGGPRIAVVGTRQGLPVSGVHQIVADGLGNLWMSSNDGIFRTRLDDLNAVADGRLLHLETVLYTERDGMGVREANGSVQDAGLRDRAGRIWFPTLDGVVRLDPRELLRHSEPPPVYVEGLRLGEGETPLGGPVRLTPQQRSFALEFTAPSFLAPERQRFRFRLVPYDRGWIESGARREAFYTQVPPGKYRFEVMAAGPDGGWSPPATIPVELVPRFFETGWFRALCVLLACVMGFGLFRVWGARQQARQRRLERLVEERTATIVQQAEKLRELDALKSQFFANVSHELRTPLTLTLGPLQDVLDGRFGPLRQDLAEQVEVALSNAQRLLGLVDQLLDIARLNAGRLRLRPRRADLAAAVRQRVEAFLPLAERRGIELSLTEPVEPVEVWFDEVQIEKVFDNLLGNALKFTPRGGKVRVGLAAPPGDGPVAVSVRDTGPGIPADQLERVFERFYQVEGTAQRRWPGAGIGLALARQLVELHGGTIAAESAEGEGACFTVTLRRDRDHLPSDLLDERPREREKRPPGALAIPSETPDEPMRPFDLADFDREDDRTTILVVDDHPDVRAYVRRHLEPDYRILEAADGVEGLEQARRFVPDLVVSDVMMPGLDGNALFRSLREDPELELVPVVLLTAKASAESRIQGLRDGVDDYLVKPFDARELKARVDNLIASRKRLLAKFETRPQQPLKASEVNVTSADAAFLARVQAVVEERLGDSELSVEGLAEALGCDRSYLLRKLRALTGETPSGLIRSLRLQRAEQLLRAGAGAVSEIAYAVGFKSVAHFSNAFQERYGERPSAFAARHRGR
ncbi:MAG TPA: two-component regulator propeller domain-containing protein [Thermoanaerobaculia bacterium]|jgi:signal transduction histidine kinase/ligand-binding sensor domain-containing protein/DNA-binding response OmpR family regulator|nr:two-component regulator propeller domain-containing protein [Thermoanaerobaculia bacterium]